MQRILILGAGFAGLWAAAAAARALDQRGIGPGDVEILVINATPFHAIRVRNYEADISAARVALTDVLDPIGVRHLVGEVTGVDTAARAVTCIIDQTEIVLPYDRLVFALGSRVVRPSLPGLAAYCFDIDTYSAADVLGRHLAGLSARPRSPARDTVLVVGGGLTGIEAATEMPDRLRAILANDPQVRPRVILADRAARIGAAMGEAACAVIERALNSLGIECRPGVSVTAIDPDGATLSNGEQIATNTVIWCAGMEANPLTACFPVVRDRSGRLPVTPALKIQDMPAEFATGDAAWFKIDGTHSSVMSCQHSRPMGRFAGENAVRDLLGEPALQLAVDWYTTILDLGRWGAVYTEGWDRTVVATGTVAKRTKEVINRQRIYPPLTRDRRAILDAAAPIIQPPPAYGTQAG